MVNLTTQLSGWSIIVNKVITTRTANQVSNNQDNHNQDSNHSNKGNNLEPLKDTSKDHHKAKVNSDDVIGKLLF